MTKRKLTKHEDDIRRGLRTKPFCFGNHEMTKTQIADAKKAVKRLQGKFILDVSTQILLHNKELIKAGDAMAKQYFDLYWSMKSAESTSRYEPASITNWEEAKKFPKNS